MAGIPAGGHLFNAELVNYWMDKGSRFILFGSDAGALTEGYRNVLNTIKGSNVGERKQY